MRYTYEQMLLAVLLQMFHIQYRISKLSKTAYGISAVGTLSEPIEAIINGNSQYIELYSNCETLNKEIADTTNMNVPLSNGY